MLEVGVLLRPVFQRLRRHLGFGEENGVCIGVALEGLEDGSLQGHELRVHIPFTHLLQKTPPV